MAKQTALGKFTRALHAVGINSILNGEGMEIQTVTIFSGSYGYIDFHFDANGSFRYVDFGTVSK